MPNADQFAQTLIAAGCWSQNVAYVPGQAGNAARVTVEAVGNGTATLSGVVAAAGNTVAAVFSIPGVGTVRLTLSAVCDIGGGSVMTDGSSYYLFASSRLAVDATYLATSGFGHFNDALGTPACLLGGTRLRTRAGPLAVERLRAGDSVAVQDGGWARVAWIGRQRLVCAHHAPPERIWPVRVAPHAIAPGVPCRPVYLSPDHALLLHGHLVPASSLVNGASIHPQPHRTVTYYHVAFDKHRIMLAEALAVESYRDTGQHSRFVTVDGAASAAGMQACLPLLTGSDRLAALRGQLLERAEVLGYRRTADAGLRVAADGRSVPMLWNGASALAAVPAGTTAVTLRTRTAVPARQGVSGGDLRWLGAAVSDLRLAGRSIALDDDESLVSGWHERETAWRWTDGAATVRLNPAPHGRLLEVRTVPMLDYWQEPTGLPPP